MATGTATTKTVTKLEWEVKPEILSDNSVAYYVSMAEPDGDWCRIEAVDKGAAYRLAAMLNDPAVCCGWSWKEYRTG